MASVRDTLKAQRKAQLSEKRLTLPIKGWSGLLFVRYRPLAWEKIAALMDAIELDAEDGLAGNIDALVAGCESLRLKLGEDEHPAIQRDKDGLVSLADTLRAEGEDVFGEARFDEVACDALGIEGVSSARETVLAIFAGAVSPELSIAEHAARLGAWMRSAGEEVDDSLLGG